MRRSGSHRTISQQGGYALILVMVSMVILTILGVTAISVAQMDMKIAQNLRHHRQLAYGALAGQDHVRGLVADDAVNMHDEYETASAQPTRCSLGWIGTGAGAVDAPNVLDSNGFVLATYSVDLCQATCGSMAPGNEIGRGRHQYTVDAVATGTSPAGVSAQATVGGLILSIPGEGSCDGSSF
jgi:type II secretory pathway pseudopilin PulG